MNDNINPDPIQSVTPYPPFDMDSLSDDEIKQIIATGYKLLDKRKMAIDAGIKVSFIGNKVNKSK